MQQVEYEITSKRKPGSDLKELVEFRELFYFFALREFKIKYKQAVLGVLWVILQPLIITTIFTLSIGKFIGKDISGDLPYQVFAFSGFVVWSVFSGSVSNAGNSMLANSNIIKKIYFPRLIIPASAVIVSVIDFLIAFIVLIPFVYYYGGAFAWRALLFVPLSLMIVCTASLGFGCFFAAMSVKYRDFKYILPFFIQLLLFASPVIYPISVTSNKAIHWIMAANPMNSALTIFRASFSKEVLNFNELGISCLVTIIIFIVGVTVFKRMEAYFADLA